MSSRSLTFGLLKPHLVANSLAVRWLRKILRQDGFRVEAERRLTLNLTLAERLYHQHNTKFFYNRLVTSICSGPVIVCILSRENAIQRWRNLLGPTKVYKAIYTHPNSIRAQLGLSDTRNAAHGSDSPESVAEEINIFFPDFSVNDWYAKEKNSR